MNDRDPDSGRSYFGFGWSSSRPDNEYLSKSVQRLRRQEEMSEAADERQIAGHVTEEKISGVRWLQGLLREHGHREP